MSATVRIPGRRYAAGAIAAATLVALAATTGQPTRPAPVQWRDVIVTGSTGSLHAVEHAVAGVGGHIRRALPVIDGVSARVPAAGVAQLGHLPGVRSVTADAQGHLMGIDPVLGYDTGGDEGSLYDIAQITHAKDVWNKGVTGKGVDVALIDSGVAPVPGLTSGNVLDGPDLSFESQVPALEHLDTYGHGTHMASIIAGRDRAASGSTYANGGSHLYLGVAPDSRLVSLKVASSDGAADVSQIIAAIDWVTENAHTQGLNIRVLNLSYGTDSKQDPSVDPLDYAVENAWRAGITVVVSAGNDGANRPALADPANDPMVVAVGADDPRGTDSVGDDQVPAFSQRGTSGRHVDVIAPGVHVIGLRDPGSSIDQQNAQAVLNDRFFRGSGTSQAAAVVSGLAALYLSKFPAATPDQVKYALMHSATAPSSVKSVYTGLGVPDVNKAIGNSPAAYTQPASGATGTGSLEGARGSAHVNDGFGDLTGEQDVFGQTWNAESWAAASAAGSAWSNGGWNGHTWTGSSWNGSSWNDATWDGHTWTGHTWTDTAWDGHTWTGNTWDGHTWTGHTWTDSGWSSQTWDGADWSAADWS